MAGWLSALVVTMCGFVAINPHSPDHERESRQPAAASAGSAASLPLMKQARRAVPAVRQYQGIFAKTKTAT
jgi:hypothetical protein